MMLNPQLLIMDERAVYLYRYHPVKTHPAANKQKAINFLDGLCACCGESLLVMLSFDHVQNDGHNHFIRSTLGITAKRLGRSELLT